MQTLSTTTRKTASYKNNPGIALGSVISVTPNISGVSAQRL
jgi:hypothetical protein